MANATSLDLYAHVSSAGLRDLAFHEFKRSTSTSDLHDTHL